jgi:hypothetical protein
MNNDFDYNDRMYVCIEKDKNIICAFNDSYEKAIVGAGNTFITGDAPCAPIHYPRGSLSSLITVDKRMPKFLDQSIVKYKLRSLVNIKLI